MSMINHVGKWILRADSPRVSAPPGQIIPNGQRNIIVATPMRSGSHLAMDLLLNALPAYRRSPLYVNLDTWFVQGHLLPQPAKLERAGYVMKTHFPAGRVSGFEAEMRAQAAEGLVVVVERPLSEIRRSLERWQAAEPHLARIGNQLRNLETEVTNFHAFWSGFDPYRIAFRDLFDPVARARIVTDIAQLTGSDADAWHSPPAPESRRTPVYFNKALTRVLGHRAPRIDTSIRSLR